MMDSSDGLARSLHQLAEASDCGFAIEREAIPVAASLREVAPADATELATSFGEDFELIATLPENEVEPARGATDVPITVVGDVTNDGLTIDGDPLPDRGFTHG
jgi:thiamine-monophosphate kinase